uniref:Uncharacterized protein n=1 Tax=viral metagenome TaxID=1070528 RepID=A0A6C0CWY8_9ZZZZ
MYKKKYMKRFDAVDMENNSYNHVNDGYGQLYNSRKGSLFVCCYVMGYAVLFGFGIYVGYLMKDCDGSY